MIKWNEIKKYCVPKKRYWENLKKEDIERSKYLGKHYHLILSNILFNYKDKRCTKNLFFANLIVSSFNKEKVNLISEKLMLNDLKKCKKNNKINKI